MLNTHVNGARQIHMIDVLADQHVSHLNTDKDKQDHNKASRSERRDFQARNRAHSFVEFQFKISLRPSC